MRSHTAHARYENRQLSFRGKSPRIPEGAEVMIVFSEEVSGQESRTPDAIALLRGCAKGRNLTERLIRSRHEDRMRDRDHGPEIRS